MKNGLVEFPQLSQEQVFSFYETVRHRLPQAVFASKSRYAKGLDGLMKCFDVFVFDAYGVLNRGLERVPGAAERIKTLESLDKQVFVLTNGAGLPQKEIEAKFQRLGFDFAPLQIISSRMAAEQAMLDQPEVKLWGVISAFPQSKSDLPAPFVRLGKEPELYDKVEGFLFLSSIALTPLQLSFLRKSLTKNRRPLIVANPDVVAPQGDHLSLEPGFFSHCLADQTGISPQFCGKPFPSVYRFVQERIRGAVNPQRIVMVGDTLHTDILGARAMGWSTVLATDHGLFAGQDVISYIKKSGLIPDWIIPAL